MLRTSLFLALLLIQTTISSKLRDEDASDYEDIIDQRQNGTENHHLHINGVLMVISAPSAEILDSDKIAFNQHRPHKPQKPHDVDVNLIDAKPKPDSVRPNTEIFETSKMKMPTFFANLIEQRLKELKKP